LLPDDLGEESVWLPKGVGIDRVRSVSCWIGKAS
jgi:hypothetical protein